MNPKSLLFLISFFLFSATICSAQNNELVLARIKYRGGGDWYNDPSALRNLIRYTNQRFPVTIQERYIDVEIGSSNLMKYPFAFLTGHGNVEVNDLEVENLRKYLDQGGFLYVDDDYGLDESIREVLKRVFPSEALIELPLNHPIYKSPYPFPRGVPKVHEHNNKPPQSFGIFREGRLVVFYTYESNISDGWADPEIHNDPPAIREASLKMGVNLLLFALTQVN